MKCVLCWPLWHLLYCPTRQIPAICYFGQVQANVKMHCICNYYVPCSPATHNFTLFPPAWWRKRASYYTSDASEACGSTMELDFFHLKARWTISLLQHHTPQQWQMHSSIIMYRNCSYLYVSKAPVQRRTRSLTLMLSLLLLPLLLLLLFCSARCRCYFSLSVSCVLHLWLILEPVVNLHVRVVQESMAELFFLVRKAVYKDASEQACQSRLIIQHGIFESLYKRCKFNHQSKIYASWKPDLIVGALLTSSGEHWGEISHEVDETECK